MMANASGLRFGFGVIFIVLFSLFNRIKLGMFQFKLKHSYSDIVLSHVESYPAGWDYRTQFDFFFLQNMASIFEDYKMNVVFSKLTLPKLNNKIFMSRICVRWFTCYIYYIFFIKFIHFLFEYVINSNELKHLNF